MAARTRPEPTPAELAAEWRRRLYSPDAQVARSQDTATVPVEDRRRRGKAVARRKAS